MTRGLKSSEYKSLKSCFYAGLLLAVYGIAKGVDLMGLSALIPAVCSPMMFYAGCRSHVKAKQGEDDV